ncbi:dolichol kinase [Drosophila sechellia]|uniref:dolichol kinase n=1 Tax=Drosophila sechellia TaxID=7238 RepID=B4HT64_DROSE|nr:dolichol kinase [Drosophila sechellia]EDW48165.1 GM20049 [Drosophila sechellia]
MRSPETDSEHSETDSVGSTTDSQSSGLGAVRHQRRSTQRPDVFSIKAMAPRPNAGPGGWLCLLLPLALTVRLLHHATPACKDQARMQWLLTVAAGGMALETLCFFIYAFVKTGILVKCLVSLLPGVATSLSFYLLVDTSLTFAIIVGFVMTSAYQQIYIYTLRGFQRSFTYGEASVFVQGLVLFALSAIHRLGGFFCGGSWPSEEFETLDMIMVSALFCLLVFCVALVLFPSLRKPYRFYLWTLLLLLAVTCMPVTRPLPLLALVQFLLRDQERLAILVFYMLLVVLTCLTVAWQIGSSAKANTRVRKIFHLLIVMVYIPGLIFECALLYLATGVALAAFVVLELLRLLKIPPFADRLALAFSTFKDEKDAGELALTPFCLLIGCSMPIWMTPCPCSGDNTLALLSGILAVGVGDTAASVVGSKLGRNKWGRSSRSLEGTIAFVVSILMAVWLLAISGLVAMSQAKWFATIFAALNSALVEAFTDQVDNLVLPLIFYTIVGLA